MNKRKLKLNEIVFQIILLFSIFPIINLFGYDLPVLYTLIPVGIYLILLVIAGKISIPKILKIIMTVFLLIIAEVFLSSFIGSVTYLNTLIFPTDSIQYIARFVCITVFLLWIYHSSISSSTVIKALLITFNLAMLVGVLQWFSWPGQSLFLDLYKFREGFEQVAQADRELHLRRIHGVAQMATANGGVATFTFIFGYSIFSYAKKYNFLTLALMLFSLINLIASQSRAGLVALLFAFVIFYCIDVYINKRIFKTNLKYLIFVGSGLLFIYIQYLSGNPFIIRQVYRWNDLVESDGGARIYQIEYSLNLLTNLKQYLFGISRVFQNFSTIDFYIEVEPINIIVLYGISGFFLQYLLIFIMLIYFLKRLRIHKSNNEVIALLIASFIGLASYQVFSLGYFFYREIRIGLLPWILMGVTIGLCERNIRIHNSENNIAKVKE